MKMKIKFKNLKTPLTEREIKKLKIGDIIYLSGKIFTARDKAHKRILEFLKEKKELPFNLNNGVIFHAGPITIKENKQWKIFGLGPTTSSRMNSFAKKVISEFKIKAIIGKGGMNKKIFKENKSCIYLSMTGGTSAINLKKIKSVEKVYWEDLGLAEAVYKLKVKNFGPLILTIDSKGNSLYERKE